MSNTEEGYQLLLVFVLYAFFIHSVWLTMSGFQNVTSWFCLIFAIANCTQYIFILPAAFSGDPRHEWLLGIGETSTYLEQVIISFAAVWAGFIMSRDYMTRLVNNMLIPALKLGESQLSKYAFTFSIIGAAISCVAAIFGLHGYFIRTELLDQATSFRTALSVLTNTALLLALVTFSSAIVTSGRLALQHYILLIIWIIAGLLSGFKNLVFLPSVLLLVAAWFHGKIRVNYYLIFIFSMLLAYSVVEPMREISNASSFRMDAQEALLSATSEEYKDLRSESRSKVFDKLVNRLDSSSIAVQTLVAYNSGALAYYQSALREQYYLLPQLTFVPGILWTEKPPTDMGRQLSIELHDLSTNSLTAAAPVVAYITGGSFFVILSGFLSGTALAVGGALLHKHRSEPLRYAPVLLLGVFLSVGDTYFSSFLINLIRTIAAIIFFYWIARSFNLLESRGQATL